MVLLTVRVTGRSLTMVLVSMYVVGTQRVVVPMMVRVS